MAKISKPICLIVVLALMLSLGTVFVPQAEASPDGTTNGLLIDTASVTILTPEITDVSPRCIEELNTCKDGNWVTITGSGFD